MDIETSRRDLLRGGVAGLVLGGMPTRAVVAAASPTDGGATAAHPTCDIAGTPARCFLTEAADFEDVSRGDPVPHTLAGDALARARLTPETWRLEIVAEDKAEVARPLTLENGAALDHAALLALGQTRAVRYLKAMQCNNIALPLGQGLWEGVPLRDLVALAGPIANVRRVFYWGFHNDDPAQMFRSSLALNQVLDTPPGEMPPMVAYRLNGGPIPLERGGPVRMVVPWAHGFKSVKWLQRIVLTNRYEANDTYAEQNNDPESYLKTAAYFDSDNAESVTGARTRVTGTAMVGWPGLERVECWLRPTPTPVKELDPADPAWETARWAPATIEPLPTDWADQLPDGVLARGVWGFTREGGPKEWPMRFSVAHWHLELAGLRPGKYELRVRSVDRNGFAQPEPRPGQRSGRNAVQCKILSVG